MRPEAYYRTMPGYPIIRHSEECMRDGMQIEDRTIPVADKIRLLDALSGHIGVSPAQQGHISP